MTREEFLKLLYKRMNVPWWFITKRAGISWFQAEGSKARFNPLATTKKMVGATNFNSVGVKNYTSLEQGLQATVLTLQQPQYDKIRRRLHVSPSAKWICEAIGDSEWGTNKELLLLTLDSVKRDYNTFAQKEITT